MNAKDPILIPYDDQAEAGVLCAFICRDDLRRQMLADVSPEAIYHPPYAALWKLLREMHESGREIDPEAVAKEAGRAKIAAHEIRDVFREYGGDASADVERVAEWELRRWTLVRMKRSRRVAAYDQSVAVADELHAIRAEIDERLRRTSKLAPRPGGMDRLDDRLRGMIAGRIANLDWPEAPMLTRLVKPLSSGSITMLGGPPGDGKSFWLIGSMLGWIEQGKNVAICMLEKSDDWHLLRGLAIASGNPSVMDDRFAREHGDELWQIRDRYQPLISRLAASVFDASGIGSTLGDIARWIDVQAEANDVVIVDPISLAETGENRWVADNNFIRSCVDTVARTQSRVLLVTHPNSKLGPASLSSLMGGLAYQRATDSVLYIQKHEPEPKRFYVDRWVAEQKVPDRVVANRTICAFKSRNGIGSGHRFAFNWDPKSFRMIEQGLIKRPAEESPTTEPDEDVDRANASNEPPPSDDLPFVQ